MRVGIVAVVLLVSACGSAEPSVSAEEVFGEYVRSVEVKNDRFPNFGGSEDRLANFAAHGTPEQIQALLFRAFPCDSAGGDFPVSECRLNSAIEGAAGGAELFGRSMVVRHEDGSLEVVTLYVADGTLIDPSGQTYTDLEDFRANNDLLDADDTVLTLREVTSVPGEGELVAVTGHTPSTWQWWLLGGVVMVALLGAATVVVRRSRREHGAGHHPEHDQYQGDPN